MGVPFGSNGLKYKGVKFVGIFPSRAVEDNSSNNWKGAWFVWPVLLQVELLWSEAGVVGCVEKPNVNELGHSTHRQNCRTLFYSEALGNGRKTAFFTCLWLICLKCHGS